MLLPFLRARGIDAPQRVVRSRAAINARCWRERAHVELKVQGEEGIDEPREDVIAIGICSVETRGCRTVLVQAAPREEPPTET